jgi:hypothetical protein
MKETEILNRFNNKGIFPSDSELQFIADERGLNDSILDVELELLEVASSDVNHPYYSMTRPINESEKSESQKEFERYVSEQLN